MQKIGITESGRSVARLSRLLWEQEVASSNLAAPTNLFRNEEVFFGFVAEFITSRFIIGKVINQICKIG